MENPYSDRQLATGAGRTRGRFVCAVSAFSGVCTACALVVAAQTSDRARTEALARRASERLQTLQREADRLAADERTVINEVRALEIARQLKAEELKRADADAKKV